MARFVPELVCADALKPKVAPNSTERLLPGLRFTFPGKSGVPAFVPPQPPTPHKERMATAKRKTFERDRPMHPSLNIAVAVRSAITQNEPSNELENL